MNNTRGFFITFTGKSVLLLERDLKDLNDVLKSDLKEDLFGNE